MLFFSELFLISKKTLFFFSTWTGHEKLLVFDEEVAFEDYVFFSDRV